MCYELTHTRRYEMPNNVITCPYCNEILYRTEDAIEQFYTEGTIAVNCIECRHRFLVTMKVTFKSIKPETEIITE